MIAASGYELQTFFSQGGMMSDQVSKRWNLAGDSTALCKELDNSALRLILAHLALPYWHVIVRLKLT